MGERRRVDKKRRKSDEAVAKKAAPQRITSLIRSNPKLIGHSIVIGGARRR